MYKSDLIRASALARFDDFCANLDLDYQHMLRQSGLPLDVLAHPDSFISYSRFAELLDTCAKETDHPLFGLQYGVFQGTDVFGRLLYLFKNAETVGDSLNELMEYFHLYQHSAKLSATVEDNMVVLAYEPPLRENIPGRQAAELAIGVGKGLLKMLLGSQWNPVGVHFRSAAGASPQEYRRILGLKPQFNSINNSWVFDARLLNRPLSDSDPTLHALMRDHLDKMDELSSQQLPGYVQGLMKSLLPNGRATIDQIADYMMLSSRTLQRYLKAEGTSFQKLLDETRRGMAQRYLHESSISLTQLAGILGYSDLGNFTRAFQRWYGMNPSQWRKEKGIRPTAKLLSRRTRSPSWLRDV